MLKKVLLLTCIFSSTLAFSQGTESNDSVQMKHLEEVVIKAYEQHSQLKNAPAAINYIGPSQLNRFNNTSLVGAINITPGARMEERSPGSYRINIRGSSLRSPFGVRNVKLYYNNIPFTDPGGHSYLNQLGFYNFQSVEIIKGPGSSLYGAGTGGVMLIESQQNHWEPGVGLDYIAGSYGLNNLNVNVKAGSSSFQNSFNYQHQTSDGYREHTNLRRDVVSWDATLKTNDKNSLSAHFLYGDLYYQTPGALTLAEYTANPKSARPRVGNTPGSVESKAAVYEKTFLAGANYRQYLNEQWSNVTTIYGAFTQLLNPTTRNYGRSSEPHFGGRTFFQLQKKMNESTLKVHLGAEFQKGFTTIKTYSNVNGNPDTLQTDDEIVNTLGSVFAQIGWSVKNWIVNGGLSFNTLKVDITRFSSSPVSTQSRTYNNEVAPRIAVLRKINANLSAYASVAKGFSPPTSAEVLPSTGVINTNLNAEQGWNYEVGLRGTQFKNRFYFDINAFLFELRNTIVQRRDAAGADYFENAGSTNQKGIETFLQYYVVDNPAAFVQTVKVWASYTYHNFRYEDFKQVTNDFSGKRLPGVPLNTLAPGVDIQTKPGLYLLTTFYYSDNAPLNDANSVYASPYHLLGLRLGYKRTISEKYRLEIFGGVDNALNETYSLGNDLNAFGGRYYNAAPGINYYAGVSMKLITRGK